MTEDVDKAVARLMTALRAAWREHDHTEMHQLHRRVDQHAKTLQHVMLVSGLCLAFSAAALIVAGYWSFRAGAIVMGAE